MRKQTKLVAVASAAALLAIGASMTSFAATGWVEEDGTWYYYDKDGNKVEDDWKKSGDNWYWLDSEEGGAMAIDKLIEDDDDTYYVDANGVMVTNTWVKVVNEEQDDEDDPAEYNYYYMQSNGKAYKNSSDGTKFRTIDGKRYAFDEDGKMLYGWVYNGERLDSDSWGISDNHVYYLGEWDDGAMKTGWQKITVEDTLDDDEEKEFWFHFKSNGQKRFNNEDDKEVKEVKINGKRYGFDERGVMTYEWTRTTDSDLSSTSTWKYFSDIEDGARKTKGWFKVVAPDYANDNTFQNYNDDYGTFASTDADDETERWYYANGDGELAVGEIKKIKGKYYGFRPDDGKKGGAMLSGLVLMVTEGEKIVKVIDDGIDSDELTDLIEDNKYDGEDVDPEATLYYFGNNADEDGALKTGAVSVSLDGDSYNFLFKKSGGAESKGRGVTGIDDEKYVYKHGLKIKADSDDKYQVVYVSGDNGTDIGSEGVTVELIDSQDLRKDAEEMGQNDDGDNVSAVIVTDENDKLISWGSEYMLLNTSGAISKKKTAAKDGDDWFFYVNKDKEIVMYTNNKNLDYDDEHGAATDGLRVYDLDNWDK